MSVRLFWHMLYVAAHNSPYSKAVNDYLHLKHCFSCLLVPVVVIKRRFLLQCNRGKVKPAKCLKDLYLHHEDTSAVEDLEIPKNCQN